MPQHDVKAVLPEAWLGKKDASLEIWRDGKKLGTITISRGSIEWYPARARNPISLDWSRFDELMKSANK